MMKSPTHAATSAYVVPRSFLEKHQIVPSVLVLSPPIDAKKWLTDSHQLRGALPGPYTALASLTVDARRMFVAHAISSSARA